MNRQTRYRRFHPAEWEDQIKPLGVLFSISQRTGLRPYSSTHPPARFVVDRILILHVVDCILHVGPFGLVGAVSGHSRLEAFHSILNQKMHQFSCRPLPISSAPRAPLKENIDEPRSFSRRALAIFSIYDARGRTRSHEARFEYPENVEERQQVGRRLSMCSLYFFCGCRTFQLSSGVGSPSPIE